MRLTSALDANNHALCTETICSTATMRFQSINYEVTGGHNCGAEIEHVKPNFLKVKYTGGVDLGRLHDRS